MAQVSHLSVGLSVSPQGVPVPITALTNPAQLVHQSDPTACDFVTVWVSNNTSSAIDVTTVITAANTASTASTPISTTMTIPGKAGKVLLEAGTFLTNQNELKIWASAVGCTFTGYVYRRVQT